MGNNAPEIRFKGFTDAWEQRKLGEVVDIIGGGTPSTDNKNYWNGNVDWYTPAEIGEQIFLDGSKRKITELGYKNSSTKMLPMGTVLFTSRAGIGNTAILTKAGTTNQGFQSIVPHENEMDSYFIFSRTHELKKYGETVGAGSTFIEVSGKQMARMPIRMPRFLEEQTAIGNFFRTIDDTITLHKRKLDGLRELKKGYLQQMFPQAGERVPRVRFAGFTGEWQERKLGDVAERVTRKNVNLETELPLTISAQYGLIDQSEFFDKQIASKDVSGYFLVKNGEFAYNKSYSNGYPWGAVKRLDRYAMGVLSTLYIVFKPVYVESEFLVQYYETDSWHTEVAKRAAEGARNHGLLNITPSDFFDTALLLPKERNEQTAIGSFFRNFDEQIDAQNKKVGQLQQLKNAYLKKMFT